MKRPARFGGKNMTVDVRTARVLLRQAESADMAAVMDHGRLSGLVDDDHGQYVHLASARTIAAQHTFSPPAAGAPFVLAANAQGQTVTGLKADQLNRTVAVAGLGLSGGGLLTADKTITLASSSDPGATSAILATAAGALTIQTMTVDGTLAVTGSVSSHLIPTTTDTYHLGDPSRLWAHGWLSEMDAVLFVTNSASLIDGWFVIGHEAGTLAVDLADDDVTADFGKAMTVGDFVVLRSSLQVDYLQVGALITGTVYEVTRNLDGGADAWTAGSPFLVLGTTGDGRIELSSLTTPKIQLFAQGATYAANTELLRIGDLNGGWGYVAAKYGVAIGQYVASKNNIILDSDGILSIRNYTTERIGMTAAGILTIKDSGGAAVFTFDAAAGAEFTKPLTLAATGGIYQGTGTFAAPTTGLKLWNDGGVGRLAGYNAGVLQAYFSTDGKLYAGAGATWLDATGLNFALPASYGPMSSIKYRKSTDATIAGDVYSTTSATGAIGLVVQTKSTLDSPGGRATILLAALGVDGGASLTLDTIYAATWGSSATFGCDNVVLYGAANDLLVGGGLYVGATNVDPAAGTITCADYLVAVGGIHVGGTADPNGYLIADGNVCIGTVTKDTKVTLGLTIDQGGADDHAIGLFSSDVTHAMTDYADAHCYSSVSKAVAASGGLGLWGFSSAITGVGMWPCATTEDATRSTAAVGYMMESAYKRNGSTLANPAANQNLFVVRAGATARFILDSDGDSHQDVGTAWTNFDEYDDLDLLDRLAVGVTRPDDPLRAGFGEFLEEHRLQLEELKLVAFNEDGHHFVNMSRLSMLLVGALRQMGTRLERLEARWASQNIG